MKKTNYLVLLAVLVVVLIAGGLWLIVSRNAGTGKPLPPLPATVGSKVVRALPRVITLYQKGEGESDLAFFVSNELAVKQKGLAQFSTIDTLNEPQMTEYYGITSVPTVVFLNPEGRIFARHEGYLDQAGILRTLRSLAAKK
jgi:hypothetical protein